MSEGLGQGRVKVSKRSGWLLWALVGVLGTALGALELRVAGSSAPVEPVDTIAARSEWVFVGRVTEISVTTPVPGNLATKIVFTNVVGWKGTVSNRFELNLPGGTLGRRQVMLVGAPVFSLNGDWLIFAMKNKSGEAILAHPTQGAVPVESGLEPASAGSAFFLDQRALEGVRLRVLGGKP